jgi:hypothetical protein
MSAVPPPKRKTLVPKRQGCVKKATAHFREELVIGQK